MSLEINSNISGSSYCGWTVNRNCSGYHSSNYFSIDVSPGSTNLCSCDLSLLQSQEVEGSSDQHQHQWCDMLLVIFTNANHLSSNVSGV